MSTDTNQKFRDAFVAQFAPDMNSTATALVDAWLNQEIKYNSNQPPDANINVATTHCLDASTLMQMRVKTFKVTVGANVTSANTNIAIIALVYNNGAATGADTVLCNINTQTAGASSTGDLTANSPYSFTLNSSNVVVPIGSCLQVKVTKVGAGGLALPSCSFEVKGVPA